MSIITSTIELSKLNSSEFDSVAKEWGGRIKLIFFDIDGTLLDSSTRVPISAQQQIYRIQQKGIATAIASGRAPFAAKIIIDQLALNGAGLFYTGAMQFDPISCDVIESVALNRTDVEVVINLARSNSLHCELYTSDNYYIEAPTVYTPHHTRYLKQPPVIGCFSQELIDNPIYKIQLVVDQRTEIHKLEVVQRALPHLIYASGHGADKPEILFSSVVSPLADKKKAFQSLCRHYQLSPDQIMSIGDAGSDQVFLEQAGLGIAMGNACDEVKRCANFVTRHVDNGGLALALKLL